MPILNVTVKWSGKKFDNLELDTDGSPEDFKSQIYSLTNVSPDRQKIMVKGGILKDDTDLNKLGLKEGHSFMMMGTVGELPKAPPKSVQFLEDMTDDQVADALEIPPGLENLGNTCYMNATLQCLRTMPELQDSLQKYQGGLNGVDNRGNLVASLRNLFTDLNKSSADFPPLVFWQMLRQTFPQFSQMGQGGVPMQQDAEECWSELVSVLREKLPRESEKNFIERYMTGRFETKMTCKDAPEEGEKAKTEEFNKLACHIDININYMINGLLYSLKGEIEKNSPTLNRSAIYEQKSLISRLPYYLPIQFMRFDWKAQERVKAKILRKVKFPLEFDATEICTPDLQNKFTKAKLKLKDVADKKLNKERDEKRRKMNTDTTTATSSSATTATPMETDEEKVDWTEFLDPELIKDVGCNPTGQYELAAVLTHVGRTADSGHYIAWVKKATDEWHKFDDEKVSIIRDADIERLHGGGDWPTAYIVLYKAKSLD